MKLNNVSMLEKMICGQTCLALHQTNQVNSQKKKQSLVVTTLPSGLLF